MSQSHRFDNIVSFDAAKLWCQNCAPKVVVAGAAQLPRSSTNLNRAGQGVAPFPQPLGIPLCDQHA